MNKKIKDILIKNAAGAHFVCGFLKGDNLCACRYGSTEIEAKTALLNAVAELGFHKPQRSKWTYFELQISGGAK